MKTAFLLATVALTAATPALAQSSSPPGDCYLCQVDPATISAEQRGSGNTATLDQQDGREQLIKVRQLGGGGKIDLRQRGDVDQAYVTQLAGATGASATIVQGLARAGDVINVTQSGAATFIAFQGGYDTYGPGVAAMANITQSGPRSYASLRQYGNGNAAKLDQKNVGGDRGYIIAAQGAGFANNMNVSQHDGTNLRAAVMQGTSDSGGLDALRAHDFETATISQTGNDQLTVLYQRASHSTATISQSGDANHITAGQDRALGIDAYDTMLVTQAGSSLLATIQQNGSNDDAVVNQTGTGNVLELTQGGDQVRASLIQSGSGNTLKVTQHTN